MCFWGVSGLKKMLGADDALDVFGVHGVGGILGALLTGVFASPSLGGLGICNYVTNKCGDAADFAGIGAQLWIQFQAVLTAIVVVRRGVARRAQIVDMIIGLRVTEEEEREGLDTTYHGESAYKLVTRAVREHCTRGRLRAPASVSGMDLAVCRRVSP